jgi:hypothetical protein
LSPERYEARGTDGSSSSSTNGQEMYGQRHEDYMPNRSGRSDDDTPTFMLDVPVLNIDELNLEVNELRAHVSSRAELANFVKINVGLDVYLDDVKLDIKGLEAQALLRVQLDRVLGTLDRALEAINTNPQILTEVVQDLDSAVEDIGEDASQGARESEQNVESVPQLEDIAGQVGESTHQTGNLSDRSTDETQQAAGGLLDRTVDEQDWTVDGSGKAAETPSDESNEVDSEEKTGSLAELRIEEEYLDEHGRIVGRARDKSGNVVEEVLDDEGEVLAHNVSEEVEGRESESKDIEVDATDAARRKAEELSVKLSDIKGTGSGGRILVRDVEKASRRAESSA